MRILMAGTGTFAEPIFLSLMKFFPVGLITQPDPVVFNKRGSTRQVGCGIKNIAELNKIAVFQPADVNSDDFINKIKEINPDLVVVAAYGQIFSKKFISSCKKIINVHASLLPKYRGASPVAYAILNAELITGVSIITVEPSIDSGEILDSDYLYINSSDTTGTLESRLSKVGAELISNVVERISKGEVIKSCKQNPDLVTKAPKITKEFGLIDWKRRAHALCRHIRAMQPWPTAYTFIHQEGKEPTRISIVEASVTDLMVNTEMPGTLLVNGKLLAATGDFFVEIKVIHPSGKKQMTSEEYLRGLKNKLLHVGNIK